MFLCNICMVCSLGSMILFLLYHNPRGATLLARQSPCQVIQLLLVWSDTSSIARSGPAFSQWCHGMDLTESESPTPISQLHDSICEVLTAMEEQFVSFCHSAVSLQPIIHCLLFLICVLAHPCTIACTSAQQLGRVVKWTRTRTWKLCHRKPDWGCTTYIGLGLFDTDPWSQR